MTKYSQKITRILVIQTAFLGDVILTTALIRAIKKVFADSEMDIITIPQTSEIFKYNPHINKIFHFNKRKTLLKIFSFLNLIFCIRKNHYDLAFSVQGSLTSSLLTYLGGIPQRIGFSRQRLLTDKVFLDRKIHASKRHLNLLKIFTNRVFDYQTEIFWSEKEELTVQKIIDKNRKEGKFFIGIAPGSIWNTKRWPEEHFVSLLNILAKHEFRIFLFGGKEDFKLCQRIMEKSNSGARNFAGKLSLLESCSLIDKMDLMISNDSAPLHIANAVKTDVFALFGPTVRDFGFYPFRENDKIFDVDLYCRPCSKHGGEKCPEKHFQCMKKISPSVLADAVINYFNISKTG
ncbi:lipopolysaccharide heptosyltransferase II [candidate division KSB1 bacterium]|nr:lipopolysaccharide heptosyltransferase II [candidate division KSB1 bacterium]